MGKRELAREPSGEQGRKKNKKIWVISGTAAAVLLGGYLGLCAWVNGTDRILPNVSVAGLDVSGMTVEEAQTALDRAMEEYGGQIIGLVSYDGQLWSIAADKMGYGWSFPAEAAGAVGRENFLTGGGVYPTQLLGREHRISKTALVLVGDFLAHSYRRSLLYHPGFSTEYRQGDGSAEADRP